MIFVKLTICDLDDFGSFFPSLNIQKSMKIVSDMPLFSKVYFGSFFARFLVAFGGPKINEFH